MRLNIFRASDTKETEVVIKCREVDAEVRAVSDFIRQYTVCLECEENERKYKVSVKDIYYIDTVDGKTFVYMDNKVFSCKETLAALEKLLRDTPVTRISKNCLLNTAYLECVSPYANHRMKAEILNGESLIISRKYMESLKRKIQIAREEGK